MGYLGASEPTLVAEKLGTDVSSIPPLNAERTAHSSPTHPTSLGPSPGTVLGTWDSEEEDGVLCPLSGPSALWTVGMRHRRHDGGEGRDRDAEGSSGSSP